MKKPRNLRTFFQPLVLGLSLLPNLQAFEWNGSDGSSFRSTASWGGKPPTAAATNNGDLFINNGQNASLVYTESEGKTVFQVVDFKVGSAQHRGGELKITGGELSVASKFCLVVGQNNNQTSTLAVTGGKLTLDSRSDAPPDERTFRVGNGFAPNTQGILTVSGGTLVINTPGTPELGGFVIGNNHANGQVTLTGGLLVVASRHGTTFQPSHGRGIGRLTFGPGDGVFMQTDSKQIAFGQGGGETSYIDFQPGTRGQLSLNEATEDDYVAWVQAGKIRLNGQPTTPDKFRFVSLPPQGIYILANP